MSGVLSVIIVLLIILIFAFLQFPSGLFAIFTHFMRGKNTKKFTDDLTLSFILGLEAFLAIMWIAIYSLIFLIFLNIQDFNANIFTFIIAGILLVLGFFCFFFYFKKGKKITTLFLPRRIINNYLTRTKSAKTRLDAFLLGFFSGLPEFFMTLPLFIIGSIIIQATDFFSRSFVMVLAIIAAIIPLFIIRYLYSSDYNLAEIERFRIKLKPHFKFILSMSFLALSIAIISYGVISYGQ